MPGRFLREEENSLQKLSKLVIYYKITSYIHNYLTATSTTMTKTN